jgi:hypothetical protein
MSRRSAGSTVTAERPALWSSIPGWGIAADLIPPELINARHVKVLRKLIAAGLVALLAICGGGYYLAARENSSASADLASVQDQTGQLQAAGRRYSGVLSIQGSVRQIKIQIAQVMGADVDLVGLMGELRRNLPNTMTITQEAITISTAGVVSASGIAVGSGLDTSGLPRIGTITMTGTGRTLDDLSDYIDRLHTVPGLVDVLPVSNARSTSGKSGTQFSLTIGLTNVLLSHRFDVGGR